MHVEIHGIGKRIILEDMTNKENNMSEPKIIEIIEQGGLTVKGLSWEIENPIANVVIMQGMEEHLYRYDYFAKALNNAGYSVYGLDTFGQGLNAGPNFETIGIWPKEGFGRQVDAVDQLVLKTKENGKPTYLFCHSMGSYMGQWFIQKYSKDIEAVTLCGSGTKNGAVGLGLFLAKIIVNEKNADKKAKFLNSLMFGGFNKRIKEPRTEYDWLSYNEANVDKYIADPLCGFGPTNRFCLEFLRGMSRLYKKNMENIRKDLPIFIITGVEDPVTGYSKATLDLKKRYNKLGINNVSTKIYDHARHEILNEDLRDEVITDVIAFYKA